MKSEITEQEAKEIIVQRTQHTFGETCRRLFVVFEKVRGAQVYLLIILTTVAAVYFGATSMGNALDSPSIYSFGENQTIVVQGYITNSTVDFTQSPSASFWEAGGTKGMFILIIACIMLFVSTKIKTPITSKVVGEKWAWEEKWQLLLTKWRETGELPPVPEKKVNQNASK